MRSVGGEVQIERDGAVAVLVIDNPPVNAASAAVRRGLAAAVAAVGADDSIAAAVVIGAGPTFVAGADIREFGAPPEEPQLSAVVEAIERCPRPVVAAIDGAALGGGLELALGCDARIATRDAVVGLPEVTLGLIPGAGGTQRVPRITGVAAAIELICSGRRVDANEATRLGLVDRVSERDLRADAVAFAAALGYKRPVRDRPVRTEDAAAVARAEDAALRRGRGRPHIVAAIAAIKSAATVPFDDGLALERRSFQRLRDSAEAAAHRHLFFAERRARRVPGLDGVGPRDITRVGVVGAGTMGTGIATAFADAGYRVALSDTDPATAAAGRERIRAVYARGVAAGRLDDATAARRLALIECDDSCADADLVVEAVFEDMAVKLATFKELDAVLPPDAILASNTSYLDIDRLAAATGRPEAVVGLHFFSPANVMRLLEIVRGAATSPRTLATALSIARALGKVAVVAGVADGFIGNRIFSAYRRQCELLLDEGAYPEQIDGALEAFGFAMGPFAVSDLAGLDIAWARRRRLAPARDARERYVDVGDRLCELGRFGRKTGAGWYRYDGSRRRAPDPEVHALIDRSSAAKGIARRWFSDAEIVRRALLAMVNESALVLDEGVAARASDIDLVLVHGYGFPAHEGGPLFWAAGRDRAELLRELDELAQVTGHGFRTGHVAQALSGMRGQAA